MNSDESFLNEFLNGSDDDDTIELLALRRARKKQNEQSASSRKSRSYIDRATLEGHNRLFKDYFATIPVYSSQMFRRRFRMSRELFMRIHSRVEAHEPYFQQKRNSAGKLGLSSLQKITVALRILCYGVAADFMDEYIRIGETTTIKSLRNVGQHRLYALEVEKLSNRMKSGEGYPVDYSINGHNYNMGYYLADGIYPPWETFFKSIPLPMNRKTKHFTAAQESARKDVERAFGVLQARFAIVRGPSRYFDRDTLNKIMMACIIMHNMIVEDERELHPQPNISEYEQISTSPLVVVVSRTQTPELMNFIQSLHKIKDRAVHNQLQEDLVEHLWNTYIES
ncbi:uncharacterized protein LOC124939257 [Impatiens glandulifera]|uniref:uncharacterized protein LOC124939257 n=1 Tax=Impatiens glandulifera TaxID=253017 RepID=UPI001FB09010|nr:uncharacterized protein LOC124939257 [Impatiens glandulifera]